MYATSSTHRTIAAIASTVIGAPSGLTLARLLLPG
jgi:hypothetical protein